MFSRFGVLQVRCLVGFGVYWGLVLSGVRCLVGFGV